MNRADWKEFFGFIIPAISWQVAYTVVLKTIDNHHWQQFVLWSTYANLLAIGSIVLSSTVSKEENNPKLFWIRMAATIGLVVLKPFFWLLILYNLFAYPRGVQLITRGFIWAELPMEIVFGILSLLFSTNPVNTKSTKSTHK